MCRFLLLAVCLAAPAAQAGEEEVRRLAGQAGTKDAPAALARLLELALSGEDAAVARAAAEALARFEAAGGAALERVLREAAALEARTRALELRARGRRPEDVGFLVELASGDGPAPLRVQALDLLSCDREALPLIAPLLRAGEEKVQARVLRLLGRARHSEALARAKEILLPEAREPPPLKIAAIEVLRDEGGPDSILRLVTAAGHELGEVGEFALKSLLVMDRGALVLLLVPMLATTAPAERAVVALDVLPQLDVRAVDEVLAAVRAATDHPDPEVRIAALRAAARLEDRDALPRCERAASGLDPAVAAAAIEAITKLRRDDPGWRERLRRLVHAPRTPLRIAAVRSLAALRDESAVPLLVRLLDDESWRVREAAAEGLSELRSRAAVEPLIDRLAGERLRVRGAIVRALRRTTGMPLQDNARDWRRWWSDAAATFAVPPLAAVEAMEERLARNAALVRTRATFYGIPVDSDHLALVIDVSGSMAEPDRMLSDPDATAAGDRLAAATKLDVAKAEVEQLIARLPEGAALNLLFFSDDVERWQRGLVPLSRGHASRACAYVRERRAAGATNLFDALADALADPQLDTIYLLSDGNPTAGRIVDPIALRAEIRRRNAARGIRIHVVSIGHESALLRHLAEDSGGSCVQR